MNPTEIGELVEVLAVKMRAHGLRIVVVESDGDKVQLEAGAAAPDHAPLEQPAKKLSDRERHRAEMDAVVDGVTQG